MTVIAAPRPLLATVELPERARSWLVGNPLNRCDAPIVTARCDALVVRDDAEVVCGGLLAYQGGWQHVNACLGCYDGGAHHVGPHVSCLDPEPAACEHPGCTEPGDIEQDCAYGHGSCCGCCWIREDELAGRSWMR